MNTTAHETAAVQTIKVDGGLTLGYRELGAGPPVLLLHGWPTSSYLWRAVMAPIARTNRAIALDMPGFGESDKPARGRYDFEDFEQAIDAFLAALGIERVAIAGHDIGGPIAMHWAMSHPDRTARIVMLNTILYPEFSQEVFDFVTTMSTPQLRERATSPEGLTEFMRAGVVDQSSITDEVLAAVCAPFRSDEARRALARAGIGLDPAGFVEIAEQLPSLAVPVAAIYGEDDRILPDVADTFARLQGDLPGALVTPLPGCGHFLQEEQPQQVGTLISEFISSGE